MGGNNNNVANSGSFGQGLLGSCIPIVGLILFLVWRGEKLKAVKAAGIGALMSVITGVASYILMSVAVGIGTAVMY